MLLPNPNVETMPLTLTQPGTDEHSKHDIEVPTVEEPSEFVGD